MKRLEGFVVGLAMAIFAGDAAHGANRYWNDSTGSHLWTNTANWVENAVPGASDWAFFDTNKVRSSTLDVNRTNLNYRCINTAGTNTLQIGEGKVLTISGAGNSFGVAANSATSAVIVSGGTVRLLGGSHLLVANDNSSNFKRSEGTATFQGTTVDFENAADLRVGRPVDVTAQRKCIGVLDLSQASIRSGTALDSLKLTGGIVVGQHFGRGLLKLPAAVTNIEASYIYMEGNEATPGEDRIDLGVAPQLKRLKVGTIHAYYGDFLYSDGSQNKTGLPSNIDFYLGTAAVPGDLHLGRAHYVSTAINRYIAMKWGGFNRFEVYLANLLLGYSDNLAYHYSSVELDLSKTTNALFNGSATEFTVANTLGIGQSGPSGGRADGALKLPASVVQLTCSNLYLGGIVATNASFIQFGTNAFHTLTCKSALYLNYGKFQNVTPSGATNDGFSADGITLKLGSPTLRAPLEIGRAYGVIATAAEATLAGITNLQAYLTNAKIGQNNGWAGYATGTVDLRGAKLAPLDIAGNLQLCDGYADKAYLYLSEGSGVVGNVTMALADYNTAFLSMSNMTLTVTNSFKMGKGTPITFSSALVTNIVAGRSSGIDLQSSDTNNLAIQVTGTMKLFFLADPIDASKPCWGLRMAGDHTNFFAAMNAAGRLTWNTDGLSANSLKHFGIRYENNQTYIGVGPVALGTVILIR